MKNINGHNELIQQSGNQRSPGLARPEDFHVIESDDPNYHGMLPHHGQCGDTEKEYDALLAVREQGRPAKGKSNYETRIEKELAREDGGSKQAGE